jgi:hypothetical protein
VFFPLTVAGYTRIIPGLFWIDIAAIIWFFLAVIFIKRSGIFSLSVIISLFLQIIINLFAVYNDQFLSKYAWDFLITPMHIYLPAFAFLLYAENIKLNLQMIIDKYLYLLISYSIVCALGLILLPEDAPLRFSVPLISTFAGFIAIFTPASYLLDTNQSPKRQKIVFILTLIALLLSTGRAPLITFILLSFIIQMMTWKRKNIIILLFSICIIALVIYSTFEYLPDGLQSILSLYSTLLTGEDDSESLLSGEVVRLFLWRNAFTVWLDNFWFGIGTNQFSQLIIFPGLDTGFSPHHAILSYAVDGGLVLLILQYIPVIYILIKTSRYKDSVTKFIHIALVVGLILSVFTGNSFDYRYFVLLYLYNNYKGLMPK